MRKKEYIHIHALLAEVTRYLIENEAMSAETLSAYDALGTRPTSIHKSKQNHCEAIIVLNSAIEPCLKETHTDGQKQSVNR
ncbi:UPF0058 family protein [Haloarcula amylolytica]|uniref:Metal-binding protein n=1 Tax=Haloarcula amylolytica JCM 13557 TaxID=1227452 RepID=M0K3F9_9EURY|nr:UPF0058 family protein [Haloarcula amylolytica]EMA14654.1 hypothetical protein C442_19916 [Haloarcula amylolytica JCM 13557]